MKAIKIHMKFGNQVEPEFSPYRPQSKEVLSLSDIWSDDEKGFYVDDHRSDIQQESKVSICEDLKAYLNERTINTCANKGQDSCHPDNIHFELITRHDGTVLFQKYQTIIGGRALCYVK